MNRRTSLRSLRWILPILLAVLVLVPLLRGTGEGDSPPAPAGSSEACTVLTVIDGDTIRARCSGRRVLVRLIGIDAPEIEGPHRRAEPGGQAARREMHRLVPPGSKVLLHGDSQQPEIDSYGRRLAYLYRADDRVSVNERLIRAGHASVYRRFEFDLKERFLQAEAVANTP